MAEAIRDQRGIRFILRIAVARHDDAHHVAVGRNLREPDDDGRVDPATESNRDAVRAGHRDPQPDPFGEVR